MPQEISFSEWWTTLPLKDFFNVKIYLEAMYAYPWLWAVVYFWIGCNIGSFMNVCIYRLPLGMSLVHPRSHCPNCKYKLSTLDNVPLFSYIFLLGKCRNCGEPISPRYITVEFAVGLLFGALYLKLACFFQPFSLLPIYFLLAAVSVCLAFTDCETRTLPNKMTYLLIIAAPLYYLLRTRLVPPWEFDIREFLVSVFSAATAACFLSAFAIGGKLLFRRDALGWGDVKFLTGVAACLGIVPLLFVLFAGSLLGLTAVPLYRLFRPARKNRPFPFAPFLTAAVLFWLFGSFWLFSFLPWHAVRSLMKLMLA